MRRRDYRCPDGHVWEYVDSIRDPIYEHLPCQVEIAQGVKCRKPAARQIAVPTIGKVYRGEWVTDFPGGRSLPTEDVERRLDHKPEEPFSDKYLEQTRARRFDALERRTAKADAGELPKPPELTPDQREKVQAALKVNESK